MSVGTGLLRLAALMLEGSTPTRGLPACASSTCFLQHRDMNILLVHAFKLSTGVTVDGCLLQSDDMSRV